MILKVCQQITATICCNIYNAIPTVFPKSQSIYYKYLETSKMKGLKGLKVQGKLGSYTLKNAIGEGGFAVIYTTDNSDIICKVQNLSNSPSDTFQKQRKILTAVQHPNIAKLIDFFELSTKDAKFGLLFLENCSKGYIRNMFKMLESTKGDIPEIIIANVFYSVACALEAMHSKGLAHRDIKLQNVLISKSGQYKLIDFGSTTDQVIRQINKDNREAIGQQIQKNTTPMYRSPQQLDLYSNFQIGSKVDVFALGCMIFMMCFKKQPFEMRLSAINCQYFMPQQSIYSEQLRNLIKKCFTPNPAERPSASTLVKLLKPMLSENPKSKRFAATQLSINIDAEFEKIQNQFQKRKISSQNDSEIVKPSVMGRFKRMFSQMTTQTESWIANFIQESQQSPPLKYNRNIIAKCWQKRYKVDKVYSIIQNEAEININKSIVIIKILILLHNFLKKGPRQVIASYSKQGKVSQNNAIKILLLIYKAWKKINPNDKSEDLKRDQLICYIILLYDLVLTNKIKFCDNYSCFIEGNYCLLPYFQNQTNPKILSVKFIEDAISYLTKVVSLHQKVELLTSIPQIQSSIILSLVDEEYCLISFIVHLYCTFKESTNYLPSNPEIDESAIKNKIYELDSKIIELYSKLLKMFETDSKKYSQQMGGNFLKLNFQVIGHIKGIKVLDPQRKSVDFNISKYLSFEKNLYGLTIPDSYEGVVKKMNLGSSQNIIEPRSSENIVQLAMFKRKATERKEVVQEITQSKDSMKKRKDTQQIESITSYSQPKANNKQTEKLFTQPLHIPQPISNPQVNPFLSSFSQEKKQVSPFGPPQLKNPVYQNQFVNFDNFMKDAQIMEFSHQTLNFDFTKSKVYEQKPPQIIMDFFEKTQLSTQPKDIQIIKFEDEEFPKQPVVTKKIDSIHLIKFDEDEEGQLSGSKVINKNTPLQQIDLANLKEEIPRRNMQESSRTPVTNRKHKKQQLVHKSLDQMKVNVEDIKLLNKITIGIKRQVYLGCWKDQNVLIKTFKLQNPNQIQQEMVNLSIMLNIRPHPHLISTLGFAEKFQTHQIFIVSEVCQGGTLFHLLHETKHKLNWANKVNIAKQIAKGMLSLHINKPSIIHTNLTSQKIFLVQSYSSETQKIRIKIDFGLKINNQSQFESAYVAPQIYNKQPYSTKTDVYSYSIILWELITHRIPFSELSNTQEIVNFVIDNRRPEDSFTSSKCPQQLKDLMVSCWNEDPSKRPDFKDVLRILGTISFIES